MAGIPVSKHPIENAFFSPMEAFSKTINSTIESKGSVKSDLPGKIWGSGMFVFFIILIIICFSYSAWYKMVHGTYTSTADSVKKVLTIRRLALGKIMSGPENKHSVCLSVINRAQPYNTLPASHNALVNWRPLTVRLAGYLGGINGQRDGVFDMTFGISNAIFLGARSFIFDIDYINEYPCAPVLLYQDLNGIQRSLNTGLIKDGMTALSNYAFRGDISNYDPVVIVLYLRRVPEGEKQKSTFYKAIAQALSPLSSDHLGSTEQGNFHNCISENHLFTSEITNFQRKFIVLSNHRYTDLPEVQNPKDDLDFWTNARLHIDPMGNSSNLSSVIPSTDASSMPYATIGEASQLLLLSDKQRVSYASMTNVYKIAICPLEKLDSVLTVPNLNVLLNTLGVNSVPLDVLKWGTATCHTSSIANPVPNSLSLADLATGKSSVKGTTDPLSFWSYGGWSRKLIDAPSKIEGFANRVKKATPIPGFVIPTSAVPKKPPPSTNSNGGLVSIA